MVGRSQVAGWKSPVGAAGRGIFRGAQRLPAWHPSASFTASSSSSSFCCCSGGRGGGESFAPRRAKIYHIQSVGASGETHSALVGVGGDQQQTHRATTATTTSVFTGNYQFVCRRGIGWVTQILGTRGDGGGGGREGRLGAVEGLAAGLFPAGFFLGVWVCGHQQVDGGCGARG